MGPVYMSFSNYLENKVLNYIFSGVAMPTITLWFALSTSIPDDTSFTEVSSNNYGRIEIVRNTDNFPQATVGIMTNARSIQFPTASGDWGTVKGWGIYDAQTVGNQLVWGTFDDDTYVSASDTIIIPSNSLTIRLD
jgi:hypothetical protein